MGGPSADFKKFADASSKPWFAQKWKDKIAAGFTNSATMNGDKHSTISYLITLAMQHSMIWAGTGMMPSNTKAATRNDLNFVGGFSGLLTQSPADASPDEAPPPGDLGEASESVRRTDCGGPDGAVEKKTQIKFFRRHFANVLGQSADVPGMPSRCRGSALKWRFDRARVT